MASLHKDNKGRSPFWFASFKTPDGKWHFKSTKCTDREQAKEVAATLEKAARLAKVGKLGADQAREVIKAGVEDVLLAGGLILPSSSVRDWCKRWLEVKAVENEPTTHSRYDLAIRAFVDSLRDKADKDLSQLTVDDLLRFRDMGAKALSVSSVNTNLRVARACLNSAMKQGLIEKNPASQVNGLKERGESKRRPLTATEIRQALKTCGDSPWRGLVLIGLYTGQRLADCARLTWAQVDLAHKTIWFVTQKTGKRLSMSLAKPLADYLEKLPSADDPKTLLFPRFADMAEKNVSSLSNAFALEVLIPAGLMQPRPANKKSTGKGRTGERQVNPVTFHSLRHTFTTWLKATGASEAMAQLIVGHDSPVVSNHYTHLSENDTVDAIAKLPDITA